MRKVLLLNASWEPLCVVPLKRAVVLVLAEKADLVKEGDGEVRSASTSVPVPAVIKLRNFVKVPYRAQLPLTRPNVLKRDNRTCAYCSKHADTVDHVVPRSRGGRNEWLNVVAACGRCNNKKGSKLLSELGWKLRNTPHAPEGTRWLLIGLADRDPEWEPYLVALKQGKLVPA